MTPQQIETAARNQYNAVGDSNWSSSEIFTLIYAACLELTRDCGFVIEREYSTTTVSGTQEYEFPTNALSIKRVTYNGKKLAPITFRDDDTVTMQNQLTTDTGEPQYYTQWDSSIALRPIPDSAATLRIYTINEPQEITLTSTIEVPTFTHMSIVNYVVSQMAAKDMNFQTAQYYRQIWADDKEMIKRKLKLMKRGDAFAVVQAEELHAITDLGNQ